MRLRRLCLASKHLTHSPKFPLTTRLLFPNYRPCLPPSCSARELSAVCWFAVLFSAGCSGERSLRAVGLIRQRIDFCFSQCPRSHSFKGGEGGGVLLLLEFCNHCVCGSFPARAYAGLREGVAKTWTRPLRPPPPPAISISTPTPTPYPAHFGWSFL